MTSRCLAAVMAGLGFLLSGGTAEARYFLPREGRFLSPDRPGMVDGPNLYAYGAGNPVNNTDPFGQRVVRPSDPRVAAGFLDAISGWRAYQMFLRLDLSDVVFRIEKGIVPQPTDGVQLGMTSPTQRVFIGAGCSGIFVRQAEITIDLIVIDRANRELRQKGWLEVTLTAAEAIAHEFSHAIDILDGRYGTNLIDEERRGYRTQIEFREDYGYEPLPQEFIPPEFR